MKTVLAPIDFSAASRPVVAAAIALARAVGGRLVLLHVVPPPPVVAADFGISETSEELCQAAAESSGRRLTQLQRELQTEGTTAHAIHYVGYPGAVIVEQAERLDANYVVIGSRGHRALYDLMIGSTASYVLKRAPCPVVILPLGAKKAPRKFRSAPKLASVEV